MPCFCIDLDGTLYKGSHPIKHAAEFLDTLRTRNIKHIALTNCPERSAEGVSDRLKAMGITVAPENVLSAGMTAASMLKDKGINAVYVLGSDALKRECTSRGIEVRDHDVQAVLVGYYTDFCYDHLKTACMLALEGAELFCTNPDNTIPQGNTFIPHSGAIAAALECATGKRCVYIGKPGTYMLKDAIEIMSCNKEDIYMVGDRLDTDIMFGINCGVKTCLVLTGTTTRQMVDNSDIKPDYIFEDLAELSRTLL